MIRDKRYLYFLSDRDYNEVLGNIDFEFANPKTTRVYLVTLTADEPSPFPALSDEMKVKTEEPAATAPTRSQRPRKASNAKQSATKKEEEKSGEKAVETETKEPPREFKIDLDGIQGRIVALATPPAVIREFRRLQRCDLLLDVPDSGSLRTDSGRDLRRFMPTTSRITRTKCCLRGRTASRFPSMAPSCSIAPTAGFAKFGIIDAKPPDSPHKPGDGALNLGGMRAEVDPPQEWKEIYNEVWRQERDYFFEASMNGVDWQKIHDQYAQLLPYVADRYSLTYIMGEMIGELSNSHTYVGGGEFPDLHTVNVGLLGADYEVDSAHRHVPHSRKSTPAKTGMRIRALL